MAPEGASVLLWLVSISIGYGTGTTNRRPPRSLRAAAGKAVHGAYSLTVFS